MTLVVPDQRYKCRGSVRQPPIFVRARFQPCPKCRVFNAALATEVDKTNLPHRLFSPGGEMLGHATAIVNLPLARPAR
jgi:hypothetical protein